MRKFYSILLANILVLTGLCQENISTKDYINLTPKQQTKNLIPSRQLNNIQSNSRSIGESTWLNFQNAYNQATGSSDVNYTEVTLYNDSNAVITASDDNDYPYHYFTQRFFSGGDVFDISSSVFGDIDTNSFYILDTVAISYTYSRNVNVTDVLKIYVSTEDKVSHEGYVSSTSGNPYSIISYNNANNAPALYDTMITINLSADDTTASGYFNFIYIPMNIKFKGSQDVAVIVSYESGLNSNETVNYYTETNPFTLMYTAEGDAMSTDTTNLTSLLYDNPPTHNQGLITDYYQRFNKEDMAGVWTGFYTPSYISNIWYNRANCDHANFYYYVSDEESDEPTDTTVTDTTVIDDTTSNSDTVVVVVGDTVYMTIYDTITITETVEVEVEVPGDDVTATININIEGSCDDIATGLTEGDFDDTQLTAYPNPVADVLNININNTSSIQGDITINIYNVTGAKVMEEVINGSNAVLDMADLDAGYYVIEVIGGNAVLAHEKFMKN